MAVGNLAVGQAVELGVLDVSLISRLMILLENTNDVISVVSYFTCLVNERQHERDVVPFRSRDEPQ